MKKRKNKKYKYENSGRSMVEMIGVLSLMGLITAAAFIIVRSGQNSQKVSQVDDDVSSIVMNIRSLLLANSDYGNLPTSRSKGTELLDALSLSTSTPFGSSTTYSVVKNSSNPSQFKVLLTGLSNNDCRSLANRAWEGYAGASCNGGVLSIFFA